MAIKVRFSKDYDFKPSSQSTVGYKAGWEGPVTQACADAAVAAKAAEVVSKDVEPAKAVKANG
ncbi:hypothetical protein ABIB57_003638 [Devosia sp. UYZn731]|uniref:hypothetical protein n=1 Tax=Devosia sp. UYZn731 TaxID=3156345 RepID=UPI003390D859